MKKFQLITFFTILLFSCQSKTDFNEKNKFFKGIDNDREIYLTFINDTIVAINSDSLKTCSWNFMLFENSFNGLFKTNELKTDTIWFKANDKGVLMTESKDSLIFKTIKLIDSKIEKVQKDIEIARNFSDKGIVYECGYEIKEVSYFYERAIQEAKYKLKNPNSAKFIEAYIHKNKEFNEKNEYVKTKTTVVSLDVEAKNGFGNFIENTYYIFFIPKNEDESKFDIEFSDSPILKSSILDIYKDALKDLENSDIE